MDRPRVLSGQAIVSKGVTKIDASLPDVGLKDISPNGSWLEQKQIQAALEARKHLIEVERIEKFGNLSHAIWRDDLKLAEVTHKVGGHWQYLGHNVGKTLYLRPEETLYLMEVNCLLLKHNDIRVSLQKAYSLLINETTTLSQYRVYASLSRLGYKVFRHKIPKIKEKSTCEKSELLFKAEHVNQQLNINTEVVVNIADEPLTDSSVEIIDSKANESDLQSSTEIISEPLPSIKDNITESENNPVEINSKDTTEVKSKESNSDNVKIITDNKSTNCMETDNNLSAKPIQGNENSETNSESKETKPIEFLNKENANAIELQAVEIQANGAEKFEIENSVTKNEMEVDAESKSENEETQKSADDIINNSNENPLPDKDPQKKLIETATGVNLSDKDTNVNSEVDERINEDNGPVAMSTDCQETSPSSETIEVNMPNASVYNAIAIEVDSADSDVVMDLDTPKSQDFTSDNTKPENININKTDQTASDLLISKRNQIFQNYVTKLKKLTSRQLKPSNHKNIQELFENIPNLYKKEVATINVPEQQHIPKNIFVNQSSYVLNINQIRRRSIRSTSVDSAPYNSSDEVNGNHVRRIRSTSMSDLHQNLHFVNNIRLPQRSAMFFRPFNAWRPQNNLNYVQFNMFFQRPCYPNMFIQSRYLYHQQRPNALLRAFSLPHPSQCDAARKRMRSAKATHLQSIKNLAVRLKQLILAGNTHIQNIEALHRLLCAYNSRYKARLRLTRDFDVVNDETIVETIDLEDDDESQSKRRKLNEDGETYDANLGLLKQLALKYKHLQPKGKLTTSHKRALSKALKTFNKSYNADIYMNAEFEIIDRRCIRINSDSETDCVVNEPKKVKRKKLRNPFNILKRRSEKAELNASSSKDNKSEESDTNNIDFTDEVMRAKSYQLMSKNFSESWLPSENDFGRAEVVHKNTLNSRFTDAANEEYLFNFMKNHLDEFNSWLEAKIAFLQHMEQTDVAFQNDSEQELLLREPNDNSGLKPLIDSEDCSDMPSVLEKLRIIKNNKEINDESTLTIHFDVYNRDVQNFRKTNPPTPHFRIICLEETSRFPSTADVTSLHSTYEDKVSIVFAIVGTSSISYLQMNPVDLPVYVASNDLD